MSNNNNTTLHLIVVLVSYGRRDTPSDRTFFEAAMKTQPSASRRQPFQLSAHKLRDVTMGDNSDNHNDDDDVTKGSAAEVTRKRPNILITGTPGVGKTATASFLAVRACVRVCVCVCVARCLFRS